MKKNVCFTAKVDIELISEIANGNMLIKVSKSDKKEALLDEMNMENYYDLIMTYKIDEPSIIEMNLSTFCNFYENNKNNNSILKIIDNKCEFLLWYDLKIVINDKLKYNVYRFLSIIK